MGDALGQYSTLESLETESKVLKTVKAPLVQPPHVLLKLTHLFMTTSKNRKSRSFLVESHAGALN